jgi:paraquat-inducible protein B
METGMEATKPANRMTISRTIASIEQQIRDNLRKLASLRIEFQETYFDAESGDQVAKRKRDELRRQIDATGILIDDQTQALEAGRRQLSAAQKRESDAQAAYDWRRIQEVLPQRLSLAAKLDTAIAEVGELVRQIVVIGNAAHATAARHLSMDQSFACTPSSEQLALAIFGTFLRVSGLPKDFIMDLSPLGLDNLTMAETPSSAVESQNARILDRLPRELAEG